MNNPFLTKKDSLVEAVQSAMQDGEIRRQAEALVNEEFGVYSRKAVVREQLAAYDARLEEAYKCMKEGEQIDEIKVSTAYSYAGKKMEKERKGLLPGDRNPSSKTDLKNMKNAAERTDKDYYKNRGFKKVDEAKLAKKDYDKDGKIESPKDEVWGSRFRAAKMAGKMEEEQIDEVSAGLAQRAAHHAFVKSDKMKKDAQKEPDMHSYVQAVHKGEKKSKQGTKFAKYAAKKMEEESIDEARTKDQGYQNWPGEKKKKFFQGLKDKNGKTETQKWAEKRKKDREQKINEEQIDEISKELTRRYKEKAHASYNYSAGKRSDDEFVSGPGKKMTDVFGKPKFKERSKEAQKTDDKTIQKRLKGLSMAHKKLAKEETQVDEAAYSAKAARAGKDIGKPGKMFAKIAAKAGEKYGSEERGKKVAGAILKRIRAKHMKEDSSF